MNEELERISDIQERQTSLIMNLANSYFELLGEVGGLKQTIQTQGRLLNSCMERIMSLEGRNVLGNFNQRLEVLEANRGKMYEVSHTEFGKIVEQINRRVHELELCNVGPLPEMNVIRDRLDALETWLFTHNYAYFQEQEQGQNWQQEMEEENKSGNSSFEEHENLHVRMEDTGTHSPNCRCPYCEPQEGVIWHYGG